METVTVVFNGDQKLKFKLESFKKNNLFALSFLIPLYH